MLQEKRKHTKMLNMLEEVKPDVAQFTCGLQSQMKEQPAALTRSTWTCELWNLTLYLPPPVQTMQWLPSHHSAAHLVQILQAYGV
jgi:hypothetical protein